MMAWIMLAVAIVAEVAATLALRGVAGTWKLGPLLIVIVGYLVSFILMAMALRTLNVGAVYAIWSSLGTVGVTVAAAFLYQEQLNFTAVSGITLILVGVVVLASSGNLTHS